METKYTIKNFRVFDREGVSVLLKPLTLLTGCNSSGKSSLVKSLLLISDYFAALKSDNANGKRIDLTAHKLDFTKVPHNSLGKFSKTVNNKSEENTITFGFQAHSDMLGQDLNLEIAFASDATDSTNGYVKSIVVKKLNGATIYTSDAEDKSIGNLYEIFEEFVRFAYTQHFISTFESIEGARCIGEGETMPDDEYKTLGEKLKKHLDFIKQEYGRDVLLDINRWNNSHHRESFISKSVKDTTVIEEVMRSGILYYVPFVIEKLNGCKEEVCSILDNCKVDGSKDKAAVSIINKTIADFKSSSYDSFIEYYKNWEKNYLTNFKMWTIFKSTSTYPCMPDARSLRLCANSITMSPYNTVKVGLYSIDDGFVETSDGESDKEKTKEISQWEAQPLTFEALFEAMCILSEKFCSKEQKYFDAPAQFGNLGYSSNIERMFLTFVEEAIKETVLNVMPDALSYVSSSIINVKRLYPLESPDEFTQVLKRFIEAKRNMDKDQNYIPNTFFNKWVKKFRLGEKVSVNVDPEGLGVTLRLHKDEADEIGTLLADNGYGITQIFALLLNIEVSIMERNVSYKDPDTFIGAFSYPEKRTKVFSSPTIAVEEPEIHLHPNYQSMLAEMFYDAYKTYGIHFLIETHSEYLIRKSQLIVANIGYETNKEAEEKCPFVTYYVPKSGIPYSLGYRKDGKFVESFGSGFYDEASNLAFEIL